MHLWRKYVEPSQIDRCEQALRKRVGDRLAIISQQDRKQVLLEIACRSRKEACNFKKSIGGSIKPLPRGWLQRALRAHKSKPLKIANRDLLIPAGAAFGTGEHATTAMSLHLLQRLTCDWNWDWSALDLGTGSGILALAAKELGAKRVVGIDIDPIAISTAKENARLNKIEGVRFHVADARRWRFSPESRLGRNRDRQIDVVIANLHSELLIELLPKLEPNRWLILSGILRDQEAEFVRTLRQNRIDVVKLRRRGKWIAILADCRRTDLRQTSVAATFQRL